MKNIIRFFFFASLLVLTISGCRKTEEIAIPNNTAPPDPTIANSVKENYVNKVYISVLGREPDSLENARALSILNQNNISLADRGQFLDTVLGRTEYYDRIYNIARADLLNNLDTADITFYMAVFQFLLTDTAYKPIWPQLILEINKMDTLKRIPVDLKSGAINVVEVHRRCANNYFYDQINMGTENFVVSMFQNFLFRYPTTSELNQSKTMVDGQNAVVFFNTGHSKNEFLNIFFSSNNYFEGQVRDLFVRYLFREPTSSEINTYTVKYKNSLDYKGLQKEILSLGEYVGI